MYEIGLGVVHKDLPFKIEFFPVIGSKFLDPLVGYHVMPRREYS